MVSEDDVAPVIVECQECKSMYAAREWPDGEFEIIEREGCNCGSSDLKVIDDLDRGNSEFGGSTK